MNRSSSLTMDFQFLLDMCKDPSDVFPSGTLEYLCANEWLHKLTFYECDCFNKRRLRTEYLSHLIVCLNRAVLSGPFLRLPLDGDLPEFYTTDSNDDSYSEYCSIGSLGLIDLAEQTDLFESGNESVELPIWEESYAESPRAINNENELPSTVPSADSMVNNYNEISNEFAVPSDYELHLRYLLEAIRDELRGDSVAEENEELEKELLRYKEFIGNFSRESQNQIKQLEDSKNNLRSFLLINLQTDLIILLNEK